MNALQYRVCLLVMEPSEELKVDGRNCLGVDARERRAQEMGSTKSLNRPGGVKHEDEGNQIVRMEGYSDDIASIRHDLARQEGDAGVKSTAGLGRTRKADKASVAGWAAGLAAGSRPYREHGVGGYVREEGGACAAAAGREVNEHGDAVAARDHGGGDGRRDGVQPRDVQWGRYEAAEGEQSLEGRGVRHDWTEDGWNARTTAEAEGDHARNSVREGAHQRSAEEAHGSTVPASVESRHPQARTHVGAPILGGTAQVQSLAARNG